MHPILLELGPLTLRSYGFFMALGFAAGIALSVWLGRRRGITADSVLDLSAWIMVGSIAGARLMYVAVMPESFLRQPWTVLALWQGGLVYYGGFIGAVAAAVLFTRRSRQSFWALTDCLAPGLALGQAFGRVGCWFNGCCYGGVSEACGVEFPAVGDHLRHLPVQLYESAACLALAAVLAWHHHRGGRRSFALYMLSYAPLRFALEFLRGDAERGSLFGLPGLSPGQWTSLAVFAIGMLVFTRQGERHG